MFLRSLLRLVSTVQAWIFSDALAQRLVGTWGSSIVRFRPGKLGLLRAQEERNPAMCLCARRSNSVESLCTQHLTVVLLQNVHSWHAWLHRESFQGRDLLRIAGNPGVFTKPRRPAGRRAVIRCVGWIWTICFAWPSCRKKCRKLGNFMSFPFLFSAP